MYIKMLFKIMQNTMRDVWEKVKVPSLRKVEPQSQRSLGEGNLIRPSKDLVVIESLLQPSLDVVSILKKTLFRFPKSGSYWKSRRAVS